MKHPSQYLKPQWVSIIRDNAAAAEKAGMLHPAQFELVQQQQWFKTLVPVAYGGLELPLPQQVQLEEALSWADGSLGWVVTLCSGAGWFGGFLQPESAAGIFSNALLCLAGSGAATGTAEISGNGYIINGEWNYASGIHHATHVTANCVITKENTAVLNDDGTLLILPFVFDKKDVKVVPASWKTLGMVATGSSAYAVNDLYVDAGRCFKINAGNTVVKTPLYRYPFLQLAEATLAANIAGIAVHFTDLCETVFAQRAQQEKITPQQARQVNALLLQGINELNAARREFYHAVDQSWQMGETWAAITENLLSGVSTTSRTLAKIARQTVDMLYPYCGLQAANPETELNRVWRDLHTASQHSLLTFYD